MKKWQKTLLYDLAAILLGISLTFAFAPYEIFPLAVIAPAGLLILWMNKSPKECFWLGFIFGFGLFGFGVQWVYISIHQFGEIPALPAYAITAGMVAILAVYPGIVGYLLNRYFSHSDTTKWVCAFPAIWVAIEWARSLLLSGFPWLFLGYSQTNSPLKGYAPILSVYGVSLAVVVTSGLLVNAVLQFKKRSYQTAYLSLLAMTAIWTLGGLLSLIPWTRPQGQPVPVSLVQGAIPQEIKWSAEHLDLTFKRYRELTDPLFKKGRMIFWPETAIPLPLQNAAPFIDAMDEKAKATESRLITGIPIQDTRARGYYNAIVTLGKENQTYSKRHLVPFSEYIPFSPWLYQLLLKLHLPVSDIIPGSLNQGPLTLGKLKILASVCYEITFPELNLTSDKSISFLLTVTNDAWFGKSNAQAQHLQMAQMRAIELSRPVLMVSNDGITAIIGPDGHVLAQAPPYVPYVLNGQVQPTYGLTPWMNNGMDPLLFILLCLLAAALREKMLQKKRQQAQMAAPKNLTTK